MAPGIRTMQARTAEAADMAPPPPTAEFAPSKITITAHVSTVFAMK
jgi:hypothetical protein